MEDKDDPVEKRPTESIRDRESIEAALQSETDEPLPPEAEAIVERDAAQKHPVTPQGRRRRYLTRRNAVIATAAASIAVVALILLLLIVYKLGYVDRYVARQPANAGPAKNFS